MSGVPSVHRVDHIVKLPLFVRSLLIGRCRQAGAGSAVQSWLDSFRETSRARWAGLAVVRNAQVFLRSCPPQYDECQILLAPWKEPVLRCLP